MFRFLASVLFWAMLLVDMTTAQNITNAPNATISNSTQGAPAVTTATISNSTQGAPAVTTATISNSTQGAPAVTTATISNSTQGAPAVTTGQPTTLSTCNGSARTSPLINALTWVTIIFIFNDYFTTKNRH